jgi:hypothetical protein
MGGKRPPPSGVKNFSERSVPEVMMRVVVDVFKCKFVYTKRQGFDTS